MLPGALGRTGANSVPRAASLTQSLLGVPAGSLAAWALPGLYVVITGIGLAWGLILRAHRPRVYATIGLGAHAVTGQTAPASRIDRKSVV